MEHTEWEEPTGPESSSPSPQGSSQPVQARTKYSFTGYKYLTNANMHGAARSPLRQLYKHGQRQSQDHAPAHDFMQRHNSLDQSSGDQVQSGSASSSKAQEHRCNGQHSSSSSQPPGNEHDDNDWHRSQQEGANLQGQSNSSFHSSDGQVQDGKDEGQESAETQQQQQQQHCRFKVIDFGHADLEPVSGSSAGHVETK